MNKLTSVLIDGFYRRELLQKLPFKRTSRLLRTLYYLIHMNVSSFTTSTANPARRTMNPEISACNKASGRSHIPRSGALQRKQIFLDEDRILRVVTKLTNAEFLSEEMKNPIVMPRKHPVTRLVIRSAQRRWAPWCQQSQSRAWTMRFNSEARNLQMQGLPDAPSDCCAGANCIAACQPSAVSRIPICHVWNGPFCSICHLQEAEKVGSHFHVPHNKSYSFGRLRIDKRRIVSASNSSFSGAVSHKALEVTKERYLSKQLRRKTSVKAVAEELECQVQDKWRIHFKFNPPGAPHWGGSWERMVQEIKKILMTTVESVAGLHQEAFRTLIVRVEGILNRRPITIDENGHSVCPMDIALPGNKETQGFPTEAATLEVLRQRWYQFYLASLSNDRNHGGKGRIDIRSGDVVLLKKGSNPLVDSYITAKVVEVFRSNDGCQVSNVEDSKRKGSGTRHPTYFNHGGTSSGAHEGASCPTGIRGSVASRTGKIR
ncbi:hypothetical protein T08_11392 [Trichinella sp. T8]|nr:hypothetical protein T08_11392 [Trichinella sp. T8]